MISVLATNLVVVPAALLCLLPMKNQLRFPLWKTLLAMGILFAVLIPLVSWLDVRFSLPPNFLMFSMMVLMFIAYHLVLQVHVSKSLAAFFSVVSLMSILGMYAAIFDAARHPELGADSYTMDYALFHLIAGFLAVLLFGYFLHEYGSRVIDQLEVHKVWYLTLPFSVILLAICLFLRPAKYETFHVNQVAKAVTLILTSLLVIWIAMQVIFYFIVTSILHAARTAERNQILEMQESQFLAQQRYMDATARERHDFRHNIRLLRELYEAGDYGALGEYLSQYTESLPRNEVQPFCKNHALNAMLNYYANTAMQEGIALRIDTNLPDSLAISDIELCRVTGNILENAITACQQVEEKWIRLSFTVVNGSVLYIIASNSFSGRVRQKDGRYLSTSRSGNGVGLQSITSVAEQHGGMAQFHHEGNTFFSSVAIPLPISDQDDLS